MICLKYYQWNWRLSKEVTATHVRNEDNSILRQALVYKTFKVKKSWVSRRKVVGINYSSLCGFWPLALFGEPSKRTTEWRKEEGKRQLSLPPSLAFPPFSSIPFSKLLVSDSLPGSNSHISEAKNAEPRIPLVQGWGTRGLKATCGLLVP
jgi:hypothetical protein